MTRIVSTKNHRIVDVARLHRVRERALRRLTIVEGPEFVAAAAAAGAEVIDVFVGPESPPVDVPVTATEVSAAVLGKLAGTKTPRGPVAVVAIPDVAPLRRHDTVVLWGVADPGNVGAIIRSAAGFGFDVATVGTTADMWSPKAIRAAAAAQFGTPIVRLEDERSALESLASAGLTTCASVPRGGVEPHRLAPGPHAVLIGNEAHGLAPSVIEGADTLVTIDMAPTVESLNAAVSAGILLHTLRSNRERL